MSIAQIVQINYFLKIDYSTFHSVKHFVQKGKLYVIGIAGCINCQNICRPMWRIIKIIGYFFIDCSALLSEL
ncbi:MAG: hypothetical protein OMM_13466 [Candidatus Magnetoglobus multicellularis str. Araruama]|uniref:Uncharacterized protein n=1 Tax=Candidatus Magnetoglobus multicellularis str. Araruama TaxID=890399 RepID=A0A1V1NTM9_9BACT|nr:MAG: hypothetical protein OMM_13466 [Candidatus Magnetoglobus multicellularis str. Araruama]